MSLGIYKITPKKREKLDLMMSHYLQNCEVITLRNKVGRPKRRMSK
jgi:hypothetical protein